MTYNPITGTLGYIIKEDRVLLVHRTFRAHDDHLGKYNGLGGKMHSNEDIYTCMEREIFEESGLKVTKMELRGTINWTNFGPKGENWLGFIFLITGFEGEPFKENNEGTLKWVKLDELPSLPMWEGDRHFLPLIFDKNPDPFHAYLPYDKDKSLSFQYRR
jgi:8-oxo-dGTP diphosphatase